jgi:hypothetical protein
MLLEDTHTHTCSFFDLSYLGFNWKSDRIFDNVNSVSVFLSSSSFKCAQRMSSRKRSTTQNNDSTNVLHNRQSLLARSVTRSHVEAAGFGCIIAVPSDAARSCLTCGAACSEREEQQQQQQRTLALPDASTSA